MAGFRVSVDVAPYRIFDRLGIHTLVGQGLDPAVKSNKHTSPNGEGKSHRFGRSKPSPLPRYYETILHNLVGVDVLGDPQNQTKMPLLYVYILPSPSATPPPLPKGEAKGKARPMGELSQSD